MPADDVRLDLEDEAIEELMDLSREADRLPGVMDAAARVGPQVGTTAVAKRLTDNVGLPVPRLRRLFVALLNFYHTQVKLKLSTEDTAEVIASNLKRLARTQDRQDTLALWQQAKPKIVEAVKQLHSDHPLETSYKAYRVATAREYDLVGMRIYTDARPVFNEAGDAIVQAVISHVLSLDYHDGRNHHVIQFNLDAVDVRELRELCERAERKAATLKRDLKQAPWPTTIFREPTDDTSATT